MSNSFEKPLDSERLSENEAHDEANVLRAELDASPKTGMMRSQYRTPEHGRFRETTPEDYDNAVAAIEELRRVAAEAPTFETYINKLKDLPWKTMDAFGLALKAVPLAFGTTLQKTILPSLKDAQFMELLASNWKRARADSKGEFIMFKDAENRLNSLKIKGVGWGEEEKRLRDE